MSVAEPVQRLFVDADACALARDFATSLWWAGYNAHQVRGICAVVNHEFAKQAVNAAPIAAPFFWLGAEADGLSNVMKPASTSREQVEAGQSDDRSGWTDLPGYWGGHK